MGPGVQPGDRHPGGFPPHLSGFSTFHVATLHPFYGWRCSSWFHDLWNQQLLHSVKLTLTPLQEWWLGDWNVQRANCQVFRDGIPTIRNSTTHPFPQSSDASRAEVVSLNVDVAASKAFEAVEWKISSTRTARTFEQWQRPQTISSFCLNIICLLQFSVVFCQCWQSTNSRNSTYCI